MLQCTGEQTLILDLLPLLRSRRGAHVLQKVKHLQLPSCLTFSSSDSASSAVINQNFLVPKQQSYSACPSQLQHSHLKSIVCWTSMKSCWFLIELSVWRALLQSSCSRVAPQTTLLKKWTTYFQALEPEQKPLLALKFTQTAPRSSAILWIFQ